MPGTFVCLLKKKLKIKNECAFAKLNKIVTAPACAFRFFNRGRPNKKTALKDENLKNITAATEVRMEQKTNYNALKKKLRSSSLSALLKKIKKTTIQYKFIGVFENILLPNIFNGLSRFEMGSIQPP